SYDRPLRWPMSTTDGPRDHPAESKCAFQSFVRLCRSGRTIVRPWIDQLAPILEQPSGLAQLSPAEKRQRVSRECGLRQQNELAGDVA
ncbi:MAG: hypothetical protein KF861_12720, partial [Planctomycetaceae bacterium]|nr:hypothetical protein [Planctomycetaceae bacterium]